MFSNLKKRLFDLGRSTRKNQKQIKAAYIEPYKHHLDMFILHFSDGGYMRAATPGEIVECANACGYCVENANKYISRVADQLIYKSVTK